MDGNTSLIQAKIREAINNGTLTKDSMERGLQALIDEEINQNERPANQELIQACLNLVDELNTAPEYVKQDERSLSKTKKRITGNRFRQLALYTRRVAAITVIILIGSFSASLIAGQNGLIGHPTEDEQQYQIQGCVTKTGYVAVGQGGDTEMQTTTEIAFLKDAITNLDFTPQFPTWMPDDWMASSFTMSITPLSEQLHITFSSEGENTHIQYDILKYSDVETAISNYEQSLNGEAHVWNEKEFYVSINVDNSFAIWLDGITQYSISGPIDQECIKAIIESIEGETV